MGSGLPTSRQVIEAAKLADADAAFGSNRLDGISMNGLNLMALPSVRSASGLRRVP
jgi:hypothetical protein